MLRNLHEVIRGMKEGIREFRRSSEEIQDEIGQALEVRPPDETDRRLMHSILLFFALLCYTIFWVVLFRAL